MILTISDSRSQRYCRSRASLAQELAIVSEETAVHWDRDGETITHKVLRLLIWNPLREWRTAINTRMEFARLADVARLDLMKLNHASGHYRCWEAEVYWCYDGTRWRRLVR